MSDYKKDIIMVYHIPIDDLSPEKAIQLLYEFSISYKNDDFYQQMFLPYTGAKDRKVIIEIINLKNNKTENVRVKLEELQDLLMKYYEPDRWKRKNKLNRILK